MQGTAAETARALSQWLESIAPVETLPRRAVSRHALLRGDRKALEKDQKGPNSCQQYKSHKLSEISFGSKNTIGRERVVREPL